MNTKELLLVGAGVLGGYLLVTYLSKNKNKLETPTSLNQPIVDQAKIDACNKKVDDFMASSKFMAGTDLEAVKKEKFESCMAGKI
jgi:hypothetical protein